jgi:hypothetical protein
MLLSAVMVSAWGRVCKYCSVVVNLARPMRSLTAWRSAPPESSQKAWAWRRSWTPRQDSTFAN